MSFSDLALDAFSFLLNMGFVVSEQRKDLVTFSSDKVVVTLAYYAYGFEVSLFLQRIGWLESFSLDDLVIYKRIPEHEQPAGYQVTTPEAQERLLQAIANMVIKCCLEIFKGDRGIWEDLRQTHAADLHASANRKQFLKALTQAEAVWKNKDFEAYIEIASHWSERLTPLMQSRLEYALKKLKEDGG